MADPDTTNAEAPAAPALPTPSLEDMQHWTWVMGRAQQLMMEHLAGQMGEAVKSAPNPEVALRYQPPVMDVELDEPLYDEDDAERAILQFQSVRYDREVEVAPGMRAIFLDAGHILGSAIIRVTATDTPSGPERTLVLSGDLGRHGNSPRHLRDGGGPGRRSGRRNERYHGQPRQRASRLR